MINTSILDQMTNTEIFSYQIYSARWLLGNGSPLCFFQLRKANFFQAFNFYPLVVCISLVCITTTEVTAKSSEKRVQESVG